MRRGGTEPSPETLSLSQLDPVPVTERVTEARDKRVTVHDTLMTPVMQTDPFDQPPRLIHCIVRENRKLSATSKFMRQKPVQQSQKVSFTNLIFSNVEGSLFSSLSHRTLL